MTNKPLNILVNFMELLIQCIVYMSISTGILLIICKRGMDYYYVALLILLPVIASYIFRLTIKNYYIFMILNIAFLVLSAMLSTTDLELMMYPLATLTVIGRSITLKQMTVRKGDYAYVGEASYDYTGLDNRDNKQLVIRASERMGIACAIIPVVFYIIAEINDNTACRKLELIFFVAFVLLYIVYNQLSKLNEEFKLSANKSEFPAKQMVNINTIMIVSMIVIMGFLMWSFYMGDYGNLFTMIGSAFYFIFKAILTAFAHLYDGDEPVTATEEKTNYDTGDIDLSGNDNYEASALATPVFIAIAAVLMLVIIVIAIIALVRYAKKFKNAKNIGSDTVEYVSAQSGMKTVPVYKNTELSERDANLNKAFRKLYRKKVLHTGKKKPKEDMLPGEITSEYITSDEAISQSITESYEKARYSKKSISQEELNALKNIK